MAAADSVGLPPRDRLPTKNLLRRVSTREALTTASYRPSSTCWAQASTKRRVSSRHVIGPRAMMAGDVSEAADTMFGCASGRQGGERPDILVP